MAARLRPRNRRLRVAAVAFGGGQDVADDQALVDDLGVGAADLAADAGVMDRVPPDAKRAAYRLTDAGRALRPTYDAIKAWGDEWLPRAPKENGPGDAGPGIY